MMKWSERLLPIMLFLVMLALGASELWTVKEPGYSVLCSDGRGYYAYLPSFLVFGETDFQQSYTAETDRLVHWKHQTYLHESEDGQTFNKYFPGVALLLLPFFLLALGPASLIYEEITGYEPLFMYAFHIAALFYAVLGLVIIRRTALLWTNNRTVALVAALLALIGTNAAYYAMYVPALSHTYSFFAIAAFVYCGTKLRAQLSKSNLIWLILSFGMVVAIRPTNLLVFLLLPGLLGSKARTIEVFQFALSNWKTLLPVALLAACPIPVINYIQTGTPWIWSYSGEGFYFTHPELFNVLFSVRKGWLLWTPMAALALVGLFYVNRWVRIWFLAFLVAMVYLVASWWNWYYGGGYGHRAFVDAYALIGLLLAITLSSSGGKFKRFVWLCAGLFLVLNVFQTYQTLVGILPKDAITPRSYARAFFEDSPSQAGRFGGLDDIPPYGKVASTESFVLVKEERLVRSDEAFPAGKAFKIQSSPGPTRYFYHVELSMKKEMPCTMNELFLILESKTSEGEVVDYRPIKLYHDREEPLHNWHNLTFNIESGLTVEDAISIYIWNKEGCTFSIRDFSIEQRTIVPFP